jgi:hypothetical protein
MSANDPKRTTVVDLPDFAFGTYAARSVHLLSQKGPTNSKVMGNILWSEGERYDDDLF